MRVGTWNLEGRWSQDHLALLAAQHCDVWLLTEVRDDIFVPGFESHLTSDKMGDGKSWAGVFSCSPLQPLPDPHPLRGLRFIRYRCCILFFRCQGGSG